MEVHGLDLSHEEIGKDVKARARMIWQLFGRDSDGDVLVGCIGC